MVLLPRRGVARLRAPSRGRLICGTEQDESNVSRRLKDGFVRDNVTLFINGISKLVRCKQIKGFFSQHGSLEKVFVICEKNKGR